MCASAATVDLLVNHGPIFSRAIGPIDPGETLHHQKVGNNANIPPGGTPRKILIRMQSLTFGFVAAVWTTPREKVGYGQQKSDPVFELPKKGIEGSNVFYYLPSMR